MAKARQQTSFGAQASTWLMTLKRPPSELRGHIEKRLIASWEPGFEYAGNWSCGVTKKMEIGDRFYLLIQGNVCAGIVAHGRITSRWYLDKHWDTEKAQRGKKALFVDVIFDDLVNPFTTNYLQRDRIKHLPPLKEITWNANASGTTIPPTAVAELDRLWSLVKRGIAKPERVPVLRQIPGDLPSRVRFETVRFVRNRSVADQVKGAYDCECQRCSKVVRVQNGARFAEAAHVRPLKHKGSDTPNNVLCLCPNCHKELDCGGFQLRLASLQFRPGHRISQDNVDYYNRRIFLGLK